MAEDFEREGGSRRSDDLIVETWMVKLQPILLTIEESASSLPQTELLHKELVLWQALNLKGKLQKLVRKTYDHDKNQ